MQSLRFACRPGRRDGTPRLKGLYVFGKKDILTLPAAGSAASTPSAASASVSIDWNHKSTNALREAINTERDEWYQRRGKMIARPIAEGWAETLLDCRSAIQFDATLCTGPRHQNSPAFGRVPVSEVPGSPRPYGVANFSLRGCATCGSSPEGFTTYRESPSENLPLLAPVPLHSSNVKAACRPQREGPLKDGSHRFVPRCWDCIRDRFCFSCLEWWCESCYQPPTLAEMQAAQHVHIVQDMNSLADHEAPGSEFPKIKVRMGYCIRCKT